jgi:CheY-like chemotaxis protein
MNENGSQRGRHLDILLIENDPATAALTREVMKEVGLDESVTSVRDGDEALAFLQAEENQGCSTDVIFLDLHLPKMSGLDVLREIKTNSAWVATPVVVVSGFLILRRSVRPMSCTRAATYVSRQISTSSCASCAFVTSFGAAWLLCQIRRAAELAIPLYGRAKDGFVLRYTHSPLRMSGSLRPSLRTPSTSISAEPIIQSTWMRLSLAPLAAS